MAVKHIMKNGEVLDSVDGITITSPEFYRVAYGILCKRNDLNKTRKDERKCQKTS